MKHAGLACSLLLAFSARAEDPGPVIAIVADNAGTETTDFLVPFGVLSRAGVAEVWAVALAAGPVELHPGLTVELPATIEAFDAAHPEGADFVIVPAMMHPENPTLLAWLRGQAERRAVSMSICDGAFVLAHAGLLEGRSATAHWYALDDLAAEFPNVHWTRDRRWVDDGAVLSTTGVTASLPGTLALVERIAGAERARAVATELGVEDWSAAHDTSAFAFDARLMWTAATNWLAFWRRDRVGIPVQDGVDEIALSLVADGLARTWRAQPIVLADGAQVMSRFGLRILTGAGPVDRVEPLPEDGASAIDATLAAIGARYGAATADFVAVQLEYDRPN
jgi:transcriptional regulator GlxA family with amidase domain